MSATAIRSAHARRVRDPRGLPTVEVEVAFAAGATSRGVAPASASRESEVSRALAGACDAIAAVLGYAFANNCCQSLVPGVIARDHGWIVSMERIAGKQGSPNASAYSASKAAVIAMARSLGEELARYEIAADRVTPEFIDHMLAKVSLAPSVRVGKLRRSSADFARRRLPSRPAECSIFPEAARRVDLEAEWIRRMGTSSPMLALPPSRGQDKAWSAAVMLDACVATRVGGPMRPPAAQALTADKPQGVGDLGEKPPPPCMATFQNIVSQA